MKTQSTTTAKATRRTSKDEARDAFIDRIASARELLTLLTRHLDDHMEVAPDEVNWAHVGDAGRIRESLKEIASTFNLIGEAK